MLKRHMGHHHGHAVNQENLRQLEANVIEFGAVPELCYAKRLTAEQFKAATMTQSSTVTIGGTPAAGTYSAIFSSPSGTTHATISTVVHQDTITIGGTATDGDYDVVFSTLAARPRARVTRAAGSPATNTNLATSVAAAITDLIATSLNGIVTSCTSSGAVVTIVYAASIAAQSLTLTAPAPGTMTASTASTNSTIAAALESAIQTARTGGALAGITSSDSVSGAVITIGAGSEVVITTSVPGGATGVVADTFTSTISLDGFPEDAWRDEARLRVVTAMSGTCTAILGDADDDNGLVTSTSLAATGTTRSTGAAEYAGRYETAFSPQLVVTSSVSLRTQAGVVDVLIDWSPAAIGP